MHHSEHNCRGARPTLTTSVFPLPNEIGTTGFDAKSNAGGGGRVSEDRPCPSRCLTLAWHRQRSATFHRRGFPITLLVADGFVHAVVHTPVRVGTGHPLLHADGAAWTRSTAVTRRPHGPTTPT